MSVVADWYSINVESADAEVQKRIEEFFISNFLSYNFGSLLAGVETILIESGADATMPEDVVAKLNSYNEATQMQIKMYIFRNMQTMTMDEILLGLQEILDVAERTQ